MTKEKLLRFFDKLIRCVYPKFCPVCNEIIPINQDYCKCSRSDSKKVSDSYCRHCGKNEAECVCQHENCVYLPDIAAVYVYAGKVRADILGLKFDNQKHIARKLGAAMAERCARVYSDVDFDIVSFVPMSKSSLRKRSYNQSQLLAKIVAEKLFVDTKPLFTKVVDTAAQHNLSGKERVKNLNNSIVLNKDVKVEGLNILLCDDVKTTGATLSQCVKVLEAAGAKRVCCICAAISEFNI